MIVILENALIKLHMDGETEKSSQNIVEECDLMFISPDSYVELELKGKSAEEILVEIKSLKREIGRLRGELERAQTEELVAVGQDVALMMQRAYLQAAKDAYAKTGAVYHMSRAEEAAAKFEQDLLSLKRLEYSIGGFFGGYSSVQIDIANGKILNVAVIQPFERELPPVKQAPDLDDLLASLRKLHIEEWRHRYDSDILDGTQWGLKLTYTNGRRPREYTGSNNYPYNFEALQELIKGIAGPDFDA